MPVAFPALDEALGKLNAARKSLYDVMQEAGPTLDMDNIKSVPGDRKAKLEWIQAKNAELPQLKEEVTNLKGLQAIASGVQDGGDQFEGGTDSPDVKGGLMSAKGLGELFTGSTAFKGFSRGMTSGPVGTIEVDLKTLFQRTAGWAPESVRSGVVTLFPTRPAPHVVNFIPNIPVNQAVYKYMEETTFTNNAIEVDENTAYTEAVLALTERSQNVQKIAVYLGITDEQLEDEPAARAYVEQRLTLMIQQRLDLQVLAGSGTGTPVQLLGTENVSGINTQALGADTLLDALHKGFTAIREQGFAEPDVVFIRPSKWETVQLQKTADGLYIWGHPSATGPQTAWGVPIVQTMAVTSTKAITGDYQTHSLLGIKRGIDVQITNSHSTDFINGKQAIRADMRAVMVHLRPKAFCQITGL